ncbi:hypothetical protein WAB97_002940 [Stenotrophomonas maltophilia]
MRWNAAGNMARKTARSIRATRISVWHMLTLPRAVRA